MIWRDTWDLYNEYKYPDETNEGCEQCHNCLWCVDCKLCWDCQSPDKPFKSSVLMWDEYINCTECKRCHNCNECDRCKSCTNCWGCRDCKLCVNCTNCEDCVFCHNCHNCKGLQFADNQHNLTDNTNISEVNEAKRKLFDQWYDEVQTNQLKERMTWGWDNYLEDKYETDDCCCPNCVRRKGVRTCNTKYRWWWFGDSIDEHHHKKYKMNNKRNRTKDEAKQLIKDIMLEAEPGDCNDYMEHIEYGY